MTIGINLISVETAANREETEVLEFLVSFCFKENEKKQWEGLLPHWMAFGFIFLSLIEDVRGKTEKIKLRLDNDKIQWLAMNEQLI